LTSTVGRLPLRGTPSLNRIYTEEGLQFYLVDVGTGELHLHCQAEGPFPKSRLKHIEEVFLAIVLGLHDRGFHEIPTWIEHGNEKQRRFAEFYGFEDSGYHKIVRYEDGSERLFDEMIYVIPTDEE
jgi:hypothetical protein